MADVATRSVSPVHGCAPLLAPGGRGELGMSSFDGGVPLSKGPLHDWQRSDLGAPLMQDEHASAAAERAESDFTADSLPAAAAVNSAILQATKRADPLFHQDGGAPRLLVGRVFS